ncbi:fimbria/pilus periplasmic chaperone [Vibrio sp. S4M6]|uniref:fimbrial biogenesis chaperone n=1 Tax=Vibrio sinus TaxID=2946865 RepID=UPI00202A08E3|nr:fimbria/pilus periplasmic chaperone [Vibrio sinus]MCL9779912.1 fimbria/pilus periplasmic chaperone [Vibrio sinus]
MSLIGLPFSASALELAPTSLEFNNSTPLKTVQLMNDTDKTVTIQAKAYVWTLDKNKQILVPTTDLFPSPTIFKIAPSKEQTIRIGLFVKNTGNKVKTYRIDLKELPTKDDESQHKKVSDIKILYNITFPVFSYPDTKVDNAWHWNKAKDSVQFTNTGGYVLSLRQLKFINAKGKSHSETPVRYILPNQTVSFPVAKDSNVTAVEQTLSNLITTNKSKVTLYK